MSQFSNALLAKIPYSHTLIDRISDLNPKYEIFKDITIRKDERVAQQSIALPQKPGGNNDLPLLNSLINKDYQQYMYADIDSNKIRRLQDYRRMAAYAEVSDAIDEICDECIVQDEDDEILKFDLRKNVEKEIKKEVRSEWDKFYTRTFDFENVGWELFRQFLIDGELFFENIVSRNKPEYGVLGTLSIPSEVINPIYDNVQNGVIKGYLLRRPVIDETQGHIKKEETVLMDKNQVVYIHSGIWNEDRSIRLPYIENARRAYKQLSLIEDSIIIYRLVRAPERLVFKVDVGNMPVPQAEAYLKKMMQNYWSRKSFDAKGGTVSQVYDPQSMLDSYWFTKRANNQGTEVSTIGGTSNTLGQLDDLTYFQKKLYKALKVPSNRLNSDDGFKDGNEITREELRFARFIMRLQRQFAIGIRDSFIVHLKLRGLWERHKLKENEIHVVFNTPTHFMALRQQQLYSLKWENYVAATQDGSISKSYAQRYMLEWSDEQMAENREWRRKDGALEWEIGQIQSLGPDFREQQSDMANAMADAGVGTTGGTAGSLGGMDSMGGGADTPPDFGPAPAPAPAPEGGGEAPAPPAEG